MKNYWILCCLASSLLPGSPPQAQETTRFVETDRQHSVFTGLFQSVWARLRALNPQGRESANAEVVYTAGIRGAEATDTLLKPYWKDDLTRDASFQAELASFSEAQSRMDQGMLEEAVSRFDDFLQQHGDSALRPNALFGKSLSLAGLGKQTESLAVMQQFVDENPGHPLVDDARKVIDELN